MLKNSVIVSVFAAFAFVAHGASDEVSVSVMEGDSVTLHTGFTMNSKDRINWYFIDIRLAQITGNQSRICQEDPCKERFSDKLKLDPQTGDLTVTNIRTNDSGVYKLMINSDSEKTFSVSVIGRSAAERDEVKKEKGESVTLHPAVKKNINDVMKWYFNDALIAEITGNQSKICEEVQCKERFRERLKVNENEGSLTISDTRNTDSGEYNLQMINISSSFSITSMKSFSVTVSDSGLSAGAVAGIVVGAVGAVVTVAVGVFGLFFYSRQRSPRNVDMEKKMQSVPYEVLENGG